MVVGDTNGTFSVENEVVLVVEGTANLLLDFEILRKEYLDPIIEYINGGPLQDSSCFFGNEYGPNQYCLVLFGTKSNEDAVQLVQYTRNVDELVKAIDNIRFTGGGAQEGSLLAEGLGFALQAFDDMKLRRQRYKNNLNVQSLLKVLLFKKYKTAACVSVL
ncbi:Mediator of RNA polymerase II transcription subunit 25 [Exaiptasia diaphana]|nr:Mediator of RNA polymerase II transcription subunit 25 [Exaiptasia diaphana]